MATRLTAVDALYGFQKVIDATLFFPGTLDLRALKVRVFLSACVCVCVFVSTLWL